MTVGAAYVAGAASGTKAKLASSASSGVETRATEVRTTAKILGTSSDTVSKYMAGTSLQAYAEDAIRRRVTSIVTDWQNSTLTADAARARIGGKASELAAAADELAKARGLRR